MFQSNWQGLHQHKTENDTETKDYGNKTKKSYTTLLSTASD